MDSYQLSINARAIARLLATAIALLLSISIIGQLSRFELGHDWAYGLVPLFDVDGERNIPTFFTILIALCSALLLAVIAASAWRRDGHEHFYWIALSIGFLYLAYDEGFQVHERLIVPMRELLGKEELGFLYFGWVVPGIAGVSVLALLFRKFVLRLPAATRRRMLIAAGLYLSGCLGMELIDGKYMEAYGHTLTYSFLTTIEEGLEMAGLATLLVTLVAHIAACSDKIEFRLRAGTEMLAVTAAQAKQSRQG